MDSEHGTAFPVVRDADRKNMLQISVEVADLAARARAGTLDAAATQGGCLSVYEPGGTTGAGMGHFTPPVNAPEPAILGVSPPQREPVLDETSGTVVHRLRMPLALTYDCRVLDGHGRDAIPPLDHRRHGGAAAAVSGRLNDRDRAPGELQTP